MSDPASSPPDPARALEAVRAQIARAAADAGRRPEDIAITAVSKKHGAERIRPALEAGHRVFGENRVQEALAKWPDLRAAYPDVELRLIGPLQTNKAKEAVAFFDVVETLDRPKLARVLAEAIDREGRAPALFVQVNTGEEPQKAGVQPDEADAFIAACRNDYGLTLAGLMAIPPADAAPGPHFALLAKIAERNGLAALSMGMSGDFEAAVRLGATHVRLGERIFGPRPN
ncbi:MAG: YggS family pyridoxal phosphate-dependent enzyme [Pseudomonadota bacterium]